MTEGVSDPIMLKPAAVDMVRSKLEKNSLKLALLSAASAAIVVFMLNT